MAVLCRWWVTIWPLWEVLNKLPDRLLILHSTWIASLNSPGTQSWWPTICPSLLTSANKDGSPQPLTARALTTQRRVLCRWWTEDSGVQIGTPAIARWRLCQSCGLLANGRSPLSTTMISMWLIQWLTLAECPLWSQFGLEPWSRTGKARQNLSNFTSESS